jgi:citrate lyase beta subunit
LKHNQFDKDFKFVLEPIEFNKYTDRQILQYCLGATLYMPATKDAVNVIMNKIIPGLTTIVLDFEDAISEEDLPKAENNVLVILDEISKGLKSNLISIDDVPLCFLRVRDSMQFQTFTDQLTLDQIKILSGFIFPKFTSGNGYAYLSHLQSLNKKYNEILYGMPILEAKELAYKEIRIYELFGIKNLLMSYKNFILNVRVGATDFSSIFGVRRGINYSIYDIMTVKDCLSDILNIFNRDGEDYVISAPVWEYFSAGKTQNIEVVKEELIQSSLLKRILIVNETIDGLLREVILDKANGFVGKTVIHPSHIKYVNAMQAVTKEEYEDAIQILHTSGGVTKSLTSNKMNEINPHKNWAKKIYHKSMVYGVIEKESSYIELFSAHNIK